MDLKSMFSVNTLQTTQHLDLQNQNGHQQNRNDLHQFMYRLLPDFSQEYPYLSKLFYLQLVLRENVLIYTEDRVDVRDIWLALSRKLELPRPQIYIVDESIKIEDLLATTNQYQRIMLYDLDHISTDTINKILNTSLQSNVSFMGIQNPHNKMKAHVSDLFTIAFIYQQQHQMENILDNFNKSDSFQPQSTFNKAKFNECIKNNFEIVGQQNEEQGFLKSYLTLLQFNIGKRGMEISQGKWKKMLKILRFIGVNKHEGCYKKMSLSDFVLAPELLCSSIEQFHKIREATSESMQNFIPYFGVQKFEKSVKNHFWLPIKEINHYLTICNNLRNKISFFYPCCKYPETAFIEVNEGAINYKVRGYEKKLMSDHHYLVDTQLSYRLKFQLKSSNTMFAHFGIACYDEQKALIRPVQACRRRNSQVLFNRIEGNILYVSNVQNLKNWVQNGSFAYQKAIGVYPDGDVSNLPPMINIIYNKNEPYSKQNCPYFKIAENSIELSSESKQWFVNFKHILKPNQTVLMNHYEGGNWIGRSINFEGKSEQWKNIEIQYKGIEFENKGCNFYPQTKYMRVMIMANYNSGYPNFEIADKDAELMFQSVEWNME